MIALKAVLDCRENGMVKALIVGCLVGMMSAVLAADVVVMDDGRTFSGIVTLQDQIVIIKMPYGSVSLPRDKVVRIELKQTPQQELAAKLDQIDEGDAKQLVALAVWAREQGLGRESKELSERTLKLDADNAQARRELGFLRIDGKWQPFDKALELARSRLAAEQYETLLKSILPALAEIAPSQKKLPEVRDLLARTQLRAGKFAAAAKVFADLASKAGGPKAFRYHAIGEILEENADGMYVLTEPYPASAGLLDTKVLVKAGPASLTRPEVLAAALRDRARERIAVGRKLMAEGNKLATSNPDRAKSKYLQALHVFVVADSLVGDITRSYRVEIARRRIAAIRKHTDTGARKFDSDLAGLGKKELSKKAYRDAVTRLMYHINNVSSGLKEVIALAGPHPRELFLEAKWAQEDLKKLDAIRQVLVTELDAGK